MEKYDIICYHGTNKKTANIILKEGFKRFTFFSRHQEDALSAGEYIFAVAFNSEKLPGSWQFTIKGKLNPKRIVEHYCLQKTIIMSNEKLRKKIFDYNMKDEVIGIGYYPKKKRGKL